MTNQQILEKPLTNLHHKRWSVLILQPSIVGFRGNNLGQTYQYHDPAWRHHLQQMVIAEDPIKYLGEHING